MRTWLRICDWRLSDVRIILILSHLEIRDNSELRAATSARGNFYASANIIGWNDFHILAHIDVVDVPLLARP